MIEQITFKKHDDSGCQNSYVSSLPAIEALGGVIKFKPGLNVIVGPNGSGKTSILKSIANHLAADQSGFSVVTEKWLRDQAWQRDYDSDEEVLLNHCEVIHDGQPIMFGDPRRSLGVTKSGLDEEFYGQGMLEYMEMSQESSGEQSNRRIMPFLKIMTENTGFPEEIGTTLDRDKLNSVWTNRVDTVIKERLMPQIPKGQKTILLDEPEAGLGLLNQILLWERVLKSKEVQENFQIILVSHSHNCLTLEGANYIELKPGYLDACRKLMSGHLDSDVAAEFATNVTHKLGKREVSMLKRIQSENGVVFKTEGVTLKRLLEIDFVRSYTQRRPSSDENGKRLSLADRISRRNELIYLITEKGEQYLKIQSN